MILNKNKNKNNISTVESVKTASHSKMSGKHCLSLRMRSTWILVSDLPQSIVDMALSSEPQESPEDRKVEKEDCKPTLEGVPELEGSPSSKY